MASKSKLSILEMALFGVLAAMTFGAKLIMSGLPNIEPVSLMIMLFAVVFGKKGLFPLYVYVAMEFLYFGVNIFSISYLYVWLVLFVEAYLMRKVQNPFAWAALSGGFGLAFGALCGMIDVFMGGFAFAFAKWTAGISFDLLHCGGNFVIALILFKPLRLLTETLYAKYRR